MSANENVSWLLMATSGIQNYIFGSNRLRLALAGSSIVSRLFDSDLAKILKELGLDLHQDKLDAGSFEKGYIGGGNALLLFKDEDKASAFIRKFSRFCLETYPGLQVLYAADRAKPDAAGEDFREIMANLFSRLDQQKALKLRTRPTIFGFNDTCRFGGGAASHLSSEALLPASSGTPIDHPTYLKLKDYHQSREVIPPPEGFEYPTELDKMGQSQGDSWIAVVHADGNGLGQHIADADSLNQLRELSQAFSTLVCKAFEGMVEKLRAQRRLWSEELDLEEDILPLRPVILGGDDATWICEYRLGLLSAAEFMNAFKTQSNGKFTACAGITICKTSYPFFRAYHMAEVLCTNAKKHFRQTNNTPAFDFHVIRGHESSDIQAVRKQQQMNSQGISLTQRPLSLEDWKKHQLFLTRHKSRNRGWFQEMRNAVHLTDAEQKSQRRNWKIRNEDIESDELWGIRQNLLHSGKSTPFLDSYEIRELTIQSMLEEYSVE